MTVRKLLKSWATPPASRPPPLMERVDQDSCQGEHRYAHGLLKTSRRVLEWGHEEIFEDEAAQGGGQESRAEVAVKSRDHDRGEEQRRGELVERGGSEREPPGHSHRHDGETVVT